MTPSETLDRLQATYATFKSYKDTGVTWKATHRDSDAGSTSEQRFSSLFVRPDSFRFEIFESRDLRGSTGSNVTTDHSRRHVISATGSRVRRHSCSEAFAEHPTSLSSALSSLVAVSSGASRLVFALLAPDLVDSTHLGEIRSIEFAPDGIVGDERCEQVCRSFKNSAFLSQSSYLGRDSGLLRRVVTRMRIDKTTQDAIAESAENRQEELHLLEDLKHRQPDLYERAAADFARSRPPPRAYSLHSTSTTTYWPQINVPIDASELEQL